MATIKKFEEIKAWQKAREMVREVYLACSKGTSSRDYGLKDQLCRAAVSTMSTITEGYGRHSDRDFAHFLTIAKASSLEVQSLLYLASDVGYVQPSDFEKLYRLADETAAMITGFGSYLRQQRKTTGLSDSLTPKLPDSETSCD